MLENEILGNIIESIYEIELLVNERVENKLNEKKFINSQMK